jgi:hypothetical protein
MKCANCGDEIDPNPPSIVAAGGWCVPTEIYEALPEPLPMCGDCKARMLMVMEVGIDPGRHGENLKVKRGGIKYERPV